MCAKASTFSLPYEKKLRSVNCLFSFITLSMLLGVLLTSIIQTTLSSLDIGHSETTVFLITMTYSLTNKNLEIKLSSHN
uniref:Uncharacterized protein n=1 Tax=Monopterus albus TaxID=43700 RepID=A0A3Q3JVV8_MONAL